MKKSLLMIGAMVAGLSVGAQQPVHVIKVANPTPAKYLQQGDETQFSRVYAQTDEAAARIANLPPMAPLTTNEVVVGQTKYTLQTNSSTYRRVAFNSDGTVSIAYTLGLGAWLSWPDRGTGYNYFDGTTWGPIATTRNEATRTGFPDLVVLDNGLEMTAAHNTANSVMHFCYRPVKGSGPWTDNTALISNPPGFGFFCLWPRMAVGGAAGDVIHHIAVTEPTGNGGAIYHGQDGCMMYSRSNDGGQTFAVQNQLLSAFDSTQVYSLNGDGYAMDAKGNTVAIVIGGFGEDVVLAKSIDGGVTWTKTIIQDFPFTPWTDVLTDTIPADGIVDTLVTNDASLSCLIDNSGNVHVWFGKMRILNDGTGATGTSYFPGTAELMYWHEGMGWPITLATPEDLNANGVLDVTDWGTYQVSLVSHPTSGIDAAGNIYLAYSSIMENTDDGTGKSFRNVYAMTTSDGGATWTTPYNISPDLTSEKVYPSMARTVNTSMHLTYMRDQIAGHGLFTATNPDPDNQDVLHDIVYADVPVADLVSGVSEHNANLNSVEVYPNPTSSNANVMVNLKNSQEVTVSVFNATGKMVSSQTKNLPMGTSILNLEVAKLSAGIYFVNIIEGTSLISKKLIIE